MTKIACFFSSKNQERVEKDDTHESRRVHTSKSIFSCLRLIILASKKGYCRSVTFGNLFEFFSGAKVGPPIWKKSGKPSVVQELESTWEKARKNRTKKPSGSKVCKSCRHWKILENACFFAKIGFDTAENEPYNSYGNLVIYGKIW